MFRVTTIPDDMMSIKKNCNAFEGKKKAMRPDWCMVLKKTSSMSGKKLMKLTHNSVIFFCVSFIFIFFPSE